MPTPDAMPPRDDWPAKAADEVVRRVDQVKGHTTDHAIKAAKYLAYGTFAGIVGTVVAILLLIFAVRLLTVAFEELGDQVGFDGDVWMVYGLLGAVFLAVGAFLWRKREPIRA